MKNRFNSSAYKKWAEAQGFELEGTCQRKKRKADDGDDAHADAVSVMTTGVALSAPAAAAAAFAAASREDDDGPPVASAPVCI